MNLTMLAICCMGVQAQEAPEMVYPQAEWSKAGDILMHTPGQELFNGVIHPSAGLFEDYFDVDKAAEEHRGYISMLEANGIRVHTVYDILKEVGIDSLRALAGKVLVYDISSIPDEDVEKTEAYRQEVLQREAYKLGVDPTAVRTMNALSAETPSAYRLNGTVASENDRGIIIQNGKKTIRKE